MSVKILIVEDEALVAMEIASALKREGYLVTNTVDSAEKAFKEIEKSLPDLILMDININGAIDGIEASQRINTIYQIPVVFLTAYSDKSVINNAIDTSPAGYLIKPFKREELYAAVTLGTSKNIKATPLMVHLSKECVYQPNISELKKVSETIPLTKKEKQLLDLLLMHKNIVVPFDTIEYELWSEKSVSSTTRRTLIHRLREKIGSNNIKTIKDFGCILEI